MRNFYNFAAFVVAAFVLAGSTPSAAQSVVDLEDVGANLATESFYNGSDGAGGFQSGTLSFNNTYTPDAGFGDSWAGWSYSNQTDNTTPGFGNQYSAFTGIGDSNSATYAVAFNGFAGSIPEILSVDGRTIEGFSITNTTYSALSMLNGDAFAKQFGGATGNDPDFFKIDILSLDATGSEIASLEFFLADYRFADNSLDYVLDDWTSVDVSSLNANRLGFRFDGSDVGMFGLNTPAYFAVDNIVVSVPEPSGAALVFLSALSLMCRRKRNRALDCIR
ncbi:DUF4465 domain-containing protein [Mariniblastus fucicola]|uniref:PEP-CTERM protein-sorting domain-containing protein n=1 Tax=Mariniblastus fucicola TaxID=980251 RepID=A0A5B9P7N5_9BACT|nr:DUF4465 domain-containing protein [Mariniblastus fucicola]QEG20952.1 hypothetical protein MFFC18_08030 [Mariniblastus fucicola]